MKTDRLQGIIFQTDKLSADNSHNHLAFSRKVRVITRRLHLKRFKGGLSKAEAVNDILIDDISERLGLRG